MKKRRVVAMSCLPHRSPLLLTIVAWLAFDRLKAPEWLYGAFGLILIFFWFVWAVDFFNREEVDVLK